MQKTHSEFILRLLLFPAWYTAMVGFAFPETASSRELIFTLFWLPVSTVVPFTFLEITVVAACGGRGKESTMMEFSVTVDTIFDESGAMYFVGVGVIKKMKNDQWTKCVKRLTLMISY